jgi:DNA-binding LytR/AlgR family response regulator
VLNRSIDWRLPATWAVLLVLSLLAHAYVEIANEAKSGYRIGIGRALAIESISHLMVAALLPALYWLHRRWPITASPRNLAIHVVSVVPYSIGHTLGMAALRLLWFVAIAGERYSFPLTFDRLAYEFAKDVVSYVMLTAGIVALHHLLRRPPALEPSETRPPTLSARFAVRRRGGTETLVDVADIDWIEASGNYAFLHIKGETFEIRSSLAKLETELDSKRFVRVHKSHLVNIARVAEVIPWVSGDWRIRLQDGAEVNLSRRYRQRFEALVPVRS